MYSEKESYLFLVLTINDWLSGSIAAFNHAFIDF